MNTKAFRCVVTTFVASAVLGAGVGWPHDVVALERRISATTCTADRLNVANMMVAQAGVRAVGSRSSLNLSCMLPDDSYFPKWSIVTLNVHVSDKNNNATESQVSVSACVTFNGIQGGHCGQPAVTGTTATGNFNLHPEVISWTSHAADFPYLRVKVPAFDVGVGASLLRGFYVRDS